MAVVKVADVEKAVAEGLKDYKEGRMTEPFKSIDEFKTALKNRGVL